jgi:uncharacterized protein
MRMAGERRWVLVTGASSGIGWALAEAFAARGDALVLTARRADRLEQLAGGLRARGTPVEVVTADLADPGAPARLMAEVEARGIVLDTLVNNAGYGLRGRFDTLPAEDELGIVEVNVAALTKLSRLVLPGLIARRRGGIMNVASMAAFLPGPYMAVYFASKAYVVSLSEALHEEARPHGVVVTAVCPGATATEFGARADLDMKKRFGTAGMSAQSVARLALAGYARRRALVVTGGTNRAGALLLKFTPRLLTRRLAGKLQV